MQSRQTSIPEIGRESRRCQNASSVHKQQLELPSLNSQEAAVKGGNYILHLVQNDTFYKKQAKKKKTVGNDSPNDGALNHRPEQSVHVEPSGSYRSRNKVLLHRVRRSAASHHGHVYYDH